MIMAGGVGYELLVSATTLGALPPAGKVARVLTHLHVRDDAMVLFGFATAAERELFLLLLGVNGVGPKLALAILSVHSPATLRRAVAEGDLDALTLVPGVGKRTAQRLMIELAAKLHTDTPDPVGVEGGPSARAEVRAALEGLGYGAEEVRYVLDTLPLDGAVEVLLKEALKLLAVERAPRPVLNGNGKSRA